MISMKHQLGWVAATVVIAVLPLCAQSGESGVSRPSTAPIVSDPITNDGYVPTPPSSSSTYAPPLKHRLTAPAGTVESDGVIISDGAPAPSHQVNVAAGSIEPTAVLVPRQHEAATDIDAGIVTKVTYPKGELPEGTMLKVRMTEALSTATTRVGNKFAAELTEPVERDGTVLLPAGSLLEGQVTEAHSGKRISGGAALHLVPRSITLPDGTHYVIHGQVTDTGMYHTTRVDSEGTIYRRDHAKETLAVMGLTTGSAAAAGAVLGAGVGAVVGAGVGAGVSTVVWLKQDHDTGLPLDTVVVFSLTSPLLLNGSHD